MTWWAWLLLGIAVWVCFVWAFLLANMRFWDHVDPQRRSR